MSARKGIYAIHDQGCDGGTSPNAFVPRITAEIRVHFPPNTVSIEEVRAALAQAIDRAKTQIEQHFEARA